MMIYANFETTDDYYPMGFLFDTKKDFLRACEDDRILAVRDIVRFRIGGETYAERQDSLRNIAIDFQRAEQGYHFYWSDYCTVTNFFESYGRKYGLLREFRENGIC